jgi:putative chitinase
MINKKKFFDSIRHSLFGGSLTISQVKQMLSFINEWEARKLTDLRHLAYTLGTTYHETGILEDGKIIRTMAPVEEMGKGRGRKYGKRVKYDGTAYTEPHIFFGRGHTQNTWWDNYNLLTIAAKKQGKPWNFLTNPELLLQTEPSIWATFHAMTTGLYTGKKLSDYFNAKVCDWINARRIINRLDKADLVAAYSLQFYQALKA